MRWWRARHRLSVDRKSTRLNSSHLVISYAVFCLKKYKYNDGIVIPDHWGNALEWVNHAPHNGTPSVGAIAVLPPGGSFFFLDVGPPPNFIPFPPRTLLVA